MRKSLASVVFLCAAACAADPPTATNESPNLAIAGSSGCVTPAFHFAASLVGGTTWIAQLTGDLDGTATVVFNQADPLSGTTNETLAVVQWDISSGLWGPVTFETDMSNRNHFIERPGSPATVFENTGSHRVRSGVAKAHLTYEGTFDLVANVTDHSYTGVICR